MLPNLIFIRQGLNLKLKGNHRGRHRRLLTINTWLSVSSSMYIYMIQKFETNVSSPWHLVLVEVEVTTKTIPLVPFLRRKNCLPSSSIACNTFPTNTISSNIYDVTCSTYLTRKQVIHTFRSYMSRLFTFHETFTLIRNLHTHVQVMFICR